MHPRDHFLSHETSLGKGHAIEQIEIGFVRIGIAKFEVFAAFWNSEFNAQRVVGGARIVRRFGHRIFFIRVGQKS